MTRPSVELSALTHADIKPTLKAMTLPMLAGMFTLMTFSLVDTFFISMLGAKQLAAISFTFPVTFTLTSMLLGFSVAASTVIATALGASQVTKARQVSQVVLLLSLGAIALLSLLGSVFCDAIFTLLGAKKDELVFIHQYMDIWFFGVLLLVLPVVGNAVLRARGDTKVPSLIMVIAGIINAVLDPILIFGFGPIPALGMQGAAYATLASWGFGSALILTLLIKRNLMSKTLLTSHCYVVHSKNILSIAFPAAGANMLTPIATGIITAMLARLSTFAVAAFGVGARLESIACIVVLALSMTLPPFVSQNFGAALPWRISAAYKLCTRFVLCWQLGVYLLLALLAKPIAYAFSDVEEVRSLICLFIWIVPLGYGVQGMIILTNSVFNALHKPRHAFMLNFIRLFMFYIPMAWLGSELMGVTGLFAGFVVANVITAFVAWCWFNRVFTQLY